MNTESNKRSRDCSSVLKNTSILRLLCWDLKKIPRWRERPNHEREPDRLNLITTEVNCGFALSSDKLHYKSYPFIMIPLPLKKVCSTAHSSSFGAFLPHSADHNELHLDIYLTCRTSATATKFLVNKIITCSMLSWSWVICMWLITVWVCFAVNRPCYVSVIANLSVVQQKPLKKQA